LWGKSFNGQSAIFCVENEAFAHQIGAVCPNFPQIWKIVRFVFILLLLQSQYKQKQKECSI